MQALSSTRVGLLVSAISPSSQVFRVGPSRPVLSWRLSFGSCFFAFLLGTCYLLLRPATVAPTNPNRPLTRSREAEKEGDSMYDAHCGGGFNGIACRFFYVRRWVPWLA